MKQPSGRLILLPGRQWVQRASVALFFTCGVALLIMSRTHNPAAVTLKAHIADGIAPVLAAASRPMDALRGVGAWIGEMAQLRQDNVALRNANIELLGWQRQAKAMEAENRALRGLLNAVPMEKTRYISARIVSDLGGPYVHSALISGGGENGVRRDQAAVSENGLLGRVVDVGASSARVLLLNDINSRVPVVAEPSGEKSILAGTNGDMPVLSYLSGESKVQVGERIVTSGDGGVFPQGIPVGVVAAVEKGAVKVQPYVNAAKTGFVSIVDYSF